MFKGFRVYLRALEIDDYKISIKWRRDDEIWNMVVGPKYYVSEAYEKKWVEDAIFKVSNKLALAICMKETNKHIGYVYLTNIDMKNRSASFAKLIGEKEYWGKGFAKEATMLMLYHGFYVLGLERIEARQLCYNKGSIKVNEKCGFKTEGILRKAVFKNGEYRDLNLMSVIREDFDAILMNYQD
jgi:RimJ/RimL family protein N-acetyltransferase